MAARAMESAVIPAQLILVGWQADGYPFWTTFIATNNAGFINRLANFGLQITPSLSIPFSRLKSTVRRAPVSCDLPGFERGRSLAERLAAALTL